MRDKHLLGMQERVKQLQAELLPLNEQLDKIQRQAHLRSSLVAWGGFAFMVAQYALFVRLTYWGTPLLREQSLSDAVLCIRLATAKQVGK